MRLNLWRLGASPEELIGADLMRDNVRSIVISFKPTLLLEGYPEEIVDQWTEVCSFYVN